MLEGFVVGGREEGVGIYEIKFYIVYFLIWLKFCGNIFYF